MMYRTRLIFGLQALVLMIPAGLTVQEVRQERLNQELIGAVSRADARAVNQLLELGADADAREKPAFNMKQFVNDAIAHFHRSEPPSAETSSESQQEPALLVLGTDKAAPDEHKWIAVVKPLLDHGANIESRDENGATLLIIATLEHDPALVRLLLQRGAKVDAALPDGETALFWADAKSAALLLKHGANINARSSQGGTPLQFAEMRGDEATVKLLRKAGASR